MKQAYGSSSNPTSLANRFNTILKKADELSVLCKIEVCVIYYGADGEWKTWPKREDAEDMAKRYKKATKRKKCLNLRQFLEKENGKKQENVKKKYPNLDHYSSQQLSQLIHSLEQTLSTLQERLRFVVAQKQGNTNLINQTQNPPSNFSLINYNHEEAPFSPASSPLNSCQNDLLMLQEELYGVGQNNITNTNFQMQQEELYGVGQNHITNTNFQMQQEELYGVGQNHITNTNFQMQQQVLYGVGENNITNTNFQMMQQQQMLYGLGQNNITNTNFQQQVFYGFDQNMSMKSDIINSNGLQHSYLSNTVPLPFSNGFQNFSYGGHMNGDNTYFSQHIF